MNAGDHTLFRRMRHTPMRDALRGRLTGRLDLRRIIDASGLPEQAKAVVWRVVKGTRLWRLEKAAVAHEIIAHFHDGLDAGAMIDDLIASFGNVPQTARLIRRAKIRQRPLAWHVMRWSRRGIGAIILLYLALALYYWTGSPNPTVNYLTVINKRADAVPEDERAWPLYRDALLAMGFTKDSNDWHIGNPNDPKRSHFSELRPGDRHWDQVQARLRQHADELALIREATARPGLGFPATFTLADPQDGPLIGTLESSNSTEHSPLSSTLLPQLNQLRLCARLLMTDLRDAAESGDADRVLANTHAMFGMADHAAETRTLISGLSASATAQYGMHEFSRVLSEQPHIFSQPQLQQLAHYLAAIDARDWLGWEGERAIFYDMIQRIYTDDGRGDGRMTYEGLRLLWSPNESDSDFSVSQPAAIISTLALPAITVSIASRSEMLQKFDEWFQEMQLQMARPSWEVDFSAADQMREETNWIRFFPFVAMTPVIAKTQRVVFIANAQRDGLLLGIALELYHRQNNSYPPILDALVPTYIPNCLTIRSPVTHCAIASRMGGPSFTASVPIALTTAAAFRIATSLMTRFTGANTTLIDEIDGLTAAYL